MFFTKYYITLGFSSGHKINLVTYKKNRKDLYSYYSKKRSYYFQNQLRKIKSLKILASLKSQTSQTTMDIEGQPVIITQKLLENLPY